MRNILAVVIAMSFFSLFGCEQAGIEPSPDPRAATAEPEHVLCGWTWSTIILDGLEHCDSQNHYSKVRADLAQVSETLTRAVIAENSPRVAQDLHITSARITRHDLDRIRRTMLRSLEQSETDGQVALCGGMSKFAQIIADKPNWAQDTIDDALSDKHKPDEHWVCYP